MLWVGKIERITKIIFIIFVLDVVFVESEVKVTVVTRKWELGRSF